MDAGANAPEPGIVDVSHEFSWENLRGGKSEASEASEERDARA